jgi:hypothetical protein
MDSGRIRPMWGSHAEYFFLTLIPNGYRPIGIGHCQARSIGSF